MPARSMTIVCAPVAVEGLIGRTWGRADRVAIATVGQDGIDTWEEFEVGWGALHDAGTEGSHHARIARFLLEHKVECVTADHMGAGMTHMLGKMGLHVQLGESGNAREAALRAFRGFADR